MHKTRFDTQCCNAVLRNKIKAGGPLAYKYACRRWLLRHYAYVMQNEVLRVRSALLATLFNLFSLFVLKTTTEPLR